MYAKLKVDNRKRGELCNILYKLYYFIMFEVYYGLYNITPYYILYSIL